MKTMIKVSITPHKPRVKYYLEKWHLNPLSQNTELLFPPTCFVPDVTHFLHTWYHPHSSLGLTLTVDVLFLSDQVRVSPMLAITVSPAIMGFELPEQGSGAQGRVWLCKYQGGLRTTVWAVM